MLQCYYINLEGDCSYEQSLSLYERLSEDRKVRVSKLKNKELAVKQTIAGVFLQHVLSRTLDIEEYDIEYTYNSQGKPFIKDSPIFFNMSHSGCYAVLAVSDCQVGVDIERLRKNHLSVAKRCFCPEEYEDILNAGDESDIELRFLEYWTMKEAYVKYIGKGLAVPLNSFRVMRKKPISRVRRCGENIKEDWTRGAGDDMLHAGNTKLEVDDAFLRTFELDKDYRVAVCTNDEAGLFNMKEIIWDKNKNVTYVDVFG